ILKEVNRDGRTMSFLAWFLDGDIDVRLPEILDLSKKVCPWLPTQIFTNGVANTELLENQKLDMANFTISTHNHELYRLVHGKDHFDDVMFNLSHFLEHKYANQKVEIHCVLTKDNVAYAQDWYDYFKPYTEHYSNVKLVLSPLVASVDNVASREALGAYTIDDLEKVVIDIAGEEGRMWTRSLIPDLKPCVLWDNLSVDTYGYWLQCCNWSNSELYNYGHIQDFIDNGIRLKDVWQKRLANRMNNRVCEGCNMKHPEWRKRLC
ncbi:MAG: hypothetical protein PHH61_06490, partial [Candidatus Nanoarchaeia archaeon]|nr:hypothetical protein [Candidatus Nanoarchaeia archaeon]